MKVEVYIEGERLDLFDDEQINVKSSAQDINDISKLFSDFSQSFSVPASDNNNKILLYYYNPDIDSGYDARLRKQSVIYVNTLDFKRGKMRLDSVKMKHGKATSYKLTFFGDTIKLKDDIGNDKLSDLTWLNNFDHDYDETIVKTGLTTGIDVTVGATTYTKAIVYPLVSYQRQYMYNSDSSDTTSTTELVNIGYNATRSDGVYFGELKPAIKASLIIEAIQQKYTDFNFTGSFFSSSRFDEIYMNMNNSTEQMNGGILVVEDVSDTGYDESSRSEDRYRYKVTVTPKAGFTDVGYTIKLYINDAVVYESADQLVGTKTVKGVLDNPTENFTAKFEVLTTVDFEFDAITYFDYIYKNIVEITESIFTNTYNNQVIDLRTIILDRLPDIKVFDFLTSIIKMFNLIARPDGTDIYIQDLQTWYAEGAIYDITPYIETTDINVKRGKIYREINYKFEESESILADEYRQSNNGGYGDLEFALVDSSGNPLADVDGGSLDIEVLFENPIYERLLDLDNSDPTTLQYCLYTDRDINAISGKPFLMYCPTISVAANTVGFKGVSAYSEISTNIIMPSHSKTIDATSFNLNFNSEVNEYTYEVWSDTIFDRYSKDYITDMFSIRRRIFDFKAILPNELLNKLELNDRLIINDRRYIQNSTYSNLVTRMDSLELINDIYDAPLASDTLNTSQFSPPTGAYSGAAQSDSSTYTGLSGKTISLVDTGDGTSWITLDDSTTTSVIFEVGFDLAQNITGADRTAQIKVTDSLNDPTYTITQEYLQVATLNFQNSENAILQSLIGLRQ